jgi:hypothetical protein
MTKKLRSGIFTHIHHAELSCIEWSHNIESRIMFINENKPRFERTMRLVLIKQIVPDNVPQRFRAQIQEIYDTMESRSSDAGIKAESLITKLGSTPGFHKAICHRNCPWSKKTHFNILGLDGTLNEKVLLK